MPTRYGREGPGIEFDRVAFFTDAVFAIAITLLVVEVGIPDLAEGLDPDTAANLLDAHAGQAPGHRLVLRRVLRHRRLLDGEPPVHRTARQYRHAARSPSWCVYLAFVAFLPFAVGDARRVLSNPLSVVIFAVNMGIVSTMEVVLFWRAGRAGLFDPAIPDDVQRWGMLMSASPVAVFILSIPIAFIRPWLGVLTGRCRFPSRSCSAAGDPPSAAAYE